MYPSRGEKKHNIPPQTQFVWCINIVSSMFNGMAQFVLFFCRYLIKFLAKLVERSEVNKMTPGNIAIVIGPNLIWPEGDGG